MRVPLDALKILRQFYNPPLVLLVLFPIFVGFFIDYELSNGYLIWVNLMWLLLFAIPYFVFQKKALYLITVCFYFLIGVIELVHWILMRAPLNIFSVLVISNTNIDETMDFLNLQSTSGLLLLIPYTALFIFKLRNPPKRLLIKKRLYPIGVITIIFCAFVIFVATAKLRWRFVPQVMSTTHAFITTIDQYQKSIKENSLQGVDAKLISNHEQQIFVLILGESGSKNHMSLYGSKRKTNPRLESRHDIIVYDNAVSGYSRTMQCIPAMISESNIENKIPFNTSIDLIDIFHSAGFKTYWLSNQLPIGVYDNIISSFANKSDYTKFVNTTGNTSREVMRSRSYDSKLFAPFSAVLNEKFDKKFIVIHLMGSHFTYNKRYPSDFDKFKGIESKEKMIAEYDNSVLFNDFVVDSLLTILKNKTKLKNDVVASAIYISDHGENVYDELDQVGHFYAKSIPKVNVEIPFLVWLSEGYLELYKDKAMAIEQNKNKPFVSDDLFQAILDINGIQSTSFEEERSVFNKNFNYKRKRILADGEDYDLK